MRILHLFRRPRSSFSSLSSIFSEEPKVLSKEPKVRDLDEGKLLDDAYERKYYEDVDKLVGKFRTQLNDFKRSVDDTALIRFIDSLISESSSRQYNIASENDDFLRRSILLEFDKDLLSLFPFYIKLPYNEFLEKEYDYFVGAIDNHSGDMSFEDPFDEIGAVGLEMELLSIKPSENVLLYGPSRTGKTQVARAYAAKKNASFLKLTFPQLIQMFIVVGANPVGHAFQLATKNSPCVIFIDDIDAIGTKQFDSQVRGCILLQKMMTFELLHQLDKKNLDVKVIAATERPDILHPSLMVSGRLGQDIDFSFPGGKARARILQFHSRKINVEPDVNFWEFVKCTGYFNMVHLKNVCHLAQLLANEWQPSANQGVNRKDVDLAIFMIRAMRKRQARKRRQANATKEGRNRPGREKIRGEETIYEEKTCLDDQTVFSDPAEAARSYFLQIQSMSMNVHPDVYFPELARVTENFSWAQLTKVCILAHLLANEWQHLADREVKHEDYDQAIFGMRGLKEKKSTEGKKIH